MALSNPITWYNLCAEFGLNVQTAVFPRDFYSKGGAPASGTLGFQDFVGRSGGAGTSYSSPNGSTLTDTETDNLSTVVISANKTVTWTYTMTSGTATGTTISVPSGSSANSIQFDLAAPIHTSKSVTWSVSANDGTATTSWTVTLNNTNDGLQGA